MVRVYNKYRIYKENRMITDDDVRKLGKLSRLVIKEEEIPALATKLNSIIRYVDQLKEYDVSAVEPMSHARVSTNVFREDIVGQHLSIEEVLKNAPDSIDRFFRVPLIKEGDE